MSEGTISANNDEAIGSIIARAMEQVGKYGVITVEEAKSIETSLEIVEGMQLDRGYLSPYFVTDAKRMECVLENALVLIHEKKISGMKDLHPRTAVKAEGDEAIGVGIIRRALEEPLRQIAGDAGHEGAVVVARLDRGSVRSSRPQAVLLVRAAE